MKTIEIIDGVAVLNAQYADEEAFSVNATEDFTLEITKLKEGGDYRILIKTDATLTITLTGQAEGTLLCDAGDNPYDLKFFDNTVFVNIENNEGEDFGGGIQKFTTTITDFATNLHELLPATDGKFWNVQNICTKQKGGGVPLIDLTDGSNEIKLAFDVDGTFGNRNVYEVSGINIGLLNQSNITDYSVPGAFINNITPTPFSVWLASAGKPIAITITNGGEGYAVDDTIGLNNNGVIRVTAIDGSSVSDWEYVSGTVSIGDIVQDSTSGDGLGFTCTATEVQPYASYGLEISNAGANYSAGRKELWIDSSSSPMGYVDITVEDGEVATVDLVSFFGSTGDIGNTYSIGESPNGEGDNYSCEVTLTQIDSTPHCGTFEIDIWATLETITTDVSSNIYYTANWPSSIENQASSFGTIYITGGGSTDLTTVSIPNITSLEYRTLMIESCYGLTSIEVPAVLDCADVYDMSSNALTEASLIAIAQALLAGGQTDKTWSINGYQNAWTAELDTYIQQLRDLGWTVTCND